MGQEKQDEQNDHGEAGDKPLMWIATPSANHFTKATRSSPSQSAISAPSQAKVVQARLCSAMSPQVSTPVISSRERSNPASRFDNRSWRDTAHSRRKSVGGDCWTGWSKRLRDPAQFAPRRRHSQEEARTRQQREGRPTESLTIYLKGRTSRFCSYQAKTEDGYSGVH